MGSTIAQKLIKSHLLSGDMTVGSEIGLRIDQTLDSGRHRHHGIPGIRGHGSRRESKTERSVAYIDHNTLQTGFENADDHRFIRTRREKTRHLLLHAPATASATRYIWSASAFRARRLIGSDSHTPTGGGIGMLAYGRRRTGRCGRDGRRRILHHHARRWSR